MGIGEIYERALRLPVRRRRRSPRVSDIAQGRRMANAIIIPVTTLLAGRGIVELALYDAGTLIKAGIAAAALVAWITARWHLSWSGRSRTLATMLGVMLMLAFASAWGMHYRDAYVAGVQMIGLRRITFIALTIAAMTAVGISMRGMHPARTEDED